MTILDVRYDVTLHTPNGTAVVATGEPDAPEHGGEWTTTRWRLDEPVSSGHTIVAGTFETDELRDASPRVQLLHSVDESSWSYRRS